MLAMQAAHREDGSVIEDEEDVAVSTKYSDNEKRIILQKSLHMAASNGEVDRVRRLVNSRAREYVDINGADEEGTAPLIYASCFVRMRIRVARIRRLNSNTGTPRSCFDPTRCRRTG